MKKSLKEELVSLAHKILQLKEGSSYEEITAEARTVYEKLAVLAYAEKLEKSNLPTIGLEKVQEAMSDFEAANEGEIHEEVSINPLAIAKACLLYTSPSPRDLSTSRMPSSA